MGNDNNSVLPDVIEPISRACLKNAFCKMCGAICGRFCLNEGGVVGYVN